MVTNLTEKQKSIVTEGVSADFWVLKLDPTNFALTYQCYRYLGVYGNVQTKEIFRILSRKNTLSEEHFLQLKALLN